jgi:hypothetical protein
LIENNCRNSPFSTISLRYPSDHFLNGPAATEDDAMTDNNRDEMVELDLESLELVAGGVGARIDDNG